MVLVLIIIGSLVVVPILSFATAVSRHNTTLSAKTARIEAVKSGLRLALADPSALYEHCGTATTLASTVTSGHTVNTTCQFIDFQVAQSADELRLGVVATEVGRTPPDSLTGDFFVPSDPTSPTEWQTLISLESVTGQVWLPNLPVHALDRRSPTGYQMPAGYPQCTVYFPGTYSDPIVLSGPVFFTSGIYYFEEEVRVASGASVVAGMGAQPGCSGDQDAAFYAENVPGTHNINGLGATWIFGDEGRLVVSNDGADPVSLTFNKRYVAPGDPGAAPSADVSILSVNGEIDPLTLDYVDLVIPDVIDVPRSEVVSGESSAPATQQEYLPSLLTPKPMAPDAPTGVSAVRYNAGAVVTWTAPYDGGSPITEYVVTASTGGICTTRGATTCAFTGLANSVAVNFSVVASNAVGSSPPSINSNNVTPSGSVAALTVPARPNAPVATAYAGAARVTWTAPAPSTAPITSYTVTASPDGATCSVDVDLASTPDLVCDIEGLDPLVLPGYTFTVVATNAVGNSTASNPSNLIIPALGLGTPPELPVPEPVEFVPTPVIELALTGGTPATVSIPGYVAIPQGRLLVHNPHGHDVRMAGGVLAARFDVTDARATGPQTVPVGFIEAIVQRKFRIVSTTPSGNERSTAVVQINQNGAYAINSWAVQ